MNEVSIKHEVLDLTTEGWAMKYDFLTPYVATQTIQFADRNEKTVANAIESATKCVEKLEEYGFIEGEHFIKNISVTDTVYQTYVYLELDNDVVVDVLLPYKSYVAEVKLISLNDRQNNELQDAFFDVRYKKDHSGDTFECHPITKQYRWYKANSFLKQLLNHREAVTNRYNNSQRKLNVVAKGIKILKKRFPNATVEAVKFWHRSSHYNEECIRVIFASKSYVTLAVYEDKNENISFSQREKWDAHYENTDQMMNRFNSQEAKN